VLFYYIFLGVCLIGIFISAFFAVKAFKMRKIVLGVFLSVVATMLFTVTLTVLLLLQWKVQFSWPCDTSAVRPEHTIARASEYNHYIFDWPQGSLAGGRANLTKTIRIK